MATVSETTRSTRITLGSLTAGPFNVGFRLFDSDGLKVFVDGEPSTDWTLTATFDDGYSDTATITFGAALPTDTVVQIDGALIPGRSDDYVNPDPGLTEKINIELARLWAAVSETRMLAYRSVRSLSEIPATDGVSGANFAEASAAAEETLLARDEVLAIQQTLPQWQSSWLTGTDYEFADLVYENGSTYFCTVPHTSGTFSTDLAAMKWEVFAQKGAAGVGIGDVLAANNGTEFNAATFRTNLGLAIGTNVQAYNQLLAAVAGLGSNGIIARLSGSTAAARTITGTANQLTVTNGDGVSGNPTIAAVIASQAEAEAGTDTTKLMTAERTAQAIAALTQSGVTWLAPQSTASGTGPFTFTDIPSWATEIIVAFSFVSLSGTESLLVQLGDAGGFETTGYSGSSASSEATVISTASAPTSGFSVSLGNAANAATGFMHIMRPFGDNEWVSSANIARGAQHTWSAQSKTLSDVLTQVRVARGGSNNFDNGRVAVGYR